MTNTVDAMDSNLTIHFASTLHPHLGSSTDNLFYSPCGLLSVLGMCQAGARGPTKDCLAGLLGLPGAGADTKQYFQSLVVEMGQTNLDSAAELLTANALWVADYLSLNADYQRTIQDVYGGELVQVDYQHAADATVQQINQWCSQNTRGKIPTIVNRGNIDADTRLILTNAIYFKGKWQHPFNDDWTTDGDFRGAGKVCMMHQTREFAYSENADFQALEMVYLDSQLAMMVLLPRGDTSKIDADLAGSYRRAVDNLQSERVAVSLPSFKMETEYLLSNSLSELGAGLAFSDGADFSGMTSTDRLKISEVIHKAFVQLDAQGTEAAAASAAVMGALCAVGEPKPPKIFEADHPFVFFIRNRQTGNILFAGRCVEP